MTTVRNKQQVIDAAAKVFGEKGYEATRLEDIAAELGILQGSLYYHIDSKAGLLRDVRVQLFQELTKNIAETAAGSGPPDEKLRLTMRRYLQYVMQVVPLLELWTKPPSDKRKTKKQAREDREMTTELRAVWLSILREGVDAGLVRSDLDLTVAMLSVLGICNSVGRWYDPAGELSIEQISDIQFNICWAGIAA